MAEKKLGICCICGVDGELSFEHVPPDAAYNDKRIFQQNLQEMIRAEEMGQKPKGAWAQRGAGRHSLCVSCNNATGRWYGTTYVSWAQQAAELLDRSGGEMSLAYPYTMHPLRALKQVLAMFCSICGPDLQKRFPDVPRFILDAERRYIPHGLKVYAYLVDPNDSTGGRISPIVKRTEGREYVFAELAFAPLAFILTGDEKPVNSHMYDISHFGHWPYHNWQTLFLKLPVLPIASVIPGDFRTPEQLAKAQKSGEKLGRIDIPS